MTFHAIRYVDGYYQAYRTIDGTDPGVNVGPRHRSPREASRFLDSLLAIPQVSPLREQSAPFAPSVVERFWEKVDRRGPDECWPWTAATSGKGYGHVNVDYLMVKAHRVSLALALGRRLQDDELALHHCDNPPCVNPAHLYVGTHSDNTRDMYARGRGATWPTCRRGHPHAEAGRKDKHGAWACRVCHRENEALRRARRSAETANPLVGETPSLRSSEASDRLPEVPLGPDLEPAAALDAVATPSLWGGG